MCVKCGTYYTVSGFWVGSNHMGSFQHNKLSDSQLQV